MLWGKDIFDVHSIIVKTELLFNILTATTNSFQLLILDDRYTGLQVIDIFSSNGRLVTIPDGILYESTPTSSKRDTASNEKGDD